MAESDSEFTSNFMANSTLTPTSLTQQLCFRSQGANMGLESESVAEFDSVFDFPHRPLTRNRALETT